MHQSTRFTSAATAFMHIINHFDKDFQLSRENEFLIWHTGVNLPTRSSSIYSLAEFAKNHGLDVKVIVGAQEYSFPNYRFQSYKKEEIENAKFSSFLLQKRARQSGVEIEEREFGFEKVKSLLEEGKVLLLRMNSQIFHGFKPLANFYAVFSYDDGIFSVLDPQEGKKDVKEAEFKDAFETLKTKCRRDNRMIVFG